MKPNINAPVINPQLHYFNEFYQENEIVLLEETRKLFHSHNTTMYGSRIIVGGWSGEGGCFEGMLPQ